MSQQSLPAPQPTTQTNKQPLTRKEWKRWQNRKHRKKVRREANLFVRWYNNLTQQFEELAPQGVVKEVQTRKAFPVLLQKSA